MLQFWDIWFLNFPKVKWNTLWYLFNRACENRWDTVWVLQSPLVGTTEFIFINTNTLILGFSKEGWEMSSWIQVHCYRNEKAKNGEVKSLSRYVRSKINKLLPLNRCWVKEEPKTVWQLIGCRKFKEFRNTRRKPVN